ncbi:sigma-70 family RNA polymerase sigma factor [Rubrimonas sp.]|uniref:sigma-70 family RNA polymerase sigma factor n=1 Tax=Rubrimonas sp. TaxID=2036015 RepID=UPI002FDD4809
MGTAPASAPAPVAPRRDDAALAREAALMRACAAGDPAAAQTVIAETAPRVLTLCVRLLGDAAEAEDATQETLLRLWRVAPQWREGEARIATWAHRVAGNLCVDRLRARRRRAGPALDEAPDPPDPAPSALERLGAAQRAQALEAALADLPERQRTAIALRHLEGWGNPEIAAALETSVEAVESLLARGRRTLARALGEMR